MTKRTPGPDPFNNPFGKVKLAQPEKAGPVAKAAPPPQRKEKPVAVDAEAAMFLEAMGEITPVKAARNQPKAEQPRLDPVKVGNDEAESLAELAELVASAGPLQQGSVPGLDPQVLARLRAGAFVRRAQLSLQGLTPGAAREAVEKFIVSSHRDGHRCVKISPAAMVPEWLAKGRLSRHVLAHCPALADDGGADAVYVLLRR